MLKTDVYFGLESHLPKALMRNETVSAPTRPPMAKMDTVMDHSRVTVSSPMGSL